VPTRLNLCANFVQVILSLACLLYDTVKQDAPGFWLTALVVVAWLTELLVLGCELRTLYMTIQRRVHAGLKKTERSPVSFFGTIYADKVNEMKVAIKSINRDPSKSLAAKMHESYLEHYIMKTPVLYQHFAARRRLTSIQMRELHRARGGARGNYGDKEKGRERDRYTESDINGDWQCDADSARGRDRDRRSDRDKEYTQTWRPIKPFNHVSELNKQILNNSDT
jgi:hypothetical protein